MYITAAFSQNSLRGTITTQNKVPLEGCHVHIGKKTFSTKKEGTYLANRLPAGSTKIFVSYVGYRAIDTTVTILGNQVLNYQKIWQRIPRRCSARGRRCIKLKNRQYSCKTYN